MKMLFFICWAFILANISFSGCYRAGTLGGGKSYKFDCSRHDLQQCLAKVKEQSPQNSIPNKWISYDNWQEKGYSFLDGHSFYFADSLGERMYYVTMVMQTLDDLPSTKPSYLAIRSIFMIDEGKPRWKTFDEVDAREMELAYERIEVHVIGKFKEFCNCNGNGIER
jgi:hypothetical protein